MKPVWAAIVYFSRGLKSHGGVPIKLDGPPVRQCAREGEWITMNAISLSSGSDLFAGLNNSSAGSAAPPSSPAMAAMQFAINESAQSMTELLGELASGSVTGGQLNVYA